MGHLPVYLNNAVRVLAALFLFSRFHQVEQGRLQIRGQLHNPALPQRGGFLPFLLLRQKLGQLFFLVHQGSGKGVNKLPGLFQLALLPEAGDQHGQRRLANFWVGAFRQVLYPLLQLGLIQRLIWRRIQQQRPVEVHGGGIPQPVAGGEFPQLLPSRLEGGVIALALHGFVQAVDKLCDLPIGQILLEGQQGV